MVLLNQAKWASAKHYCLMRGWTFQVICEDDIANLKKKAGYTGGVKPQPSYSMASEARACLADVSRHSGSTLKNNSQNC